MTFNVINLKHRDDGDMWLQLVDAAGNPAVYHDMTADQREKYESDIARFEAGEIEEKPSLAEFEKPIRIKMRSIHSEAFRKAKMHRKIKDQISAQSIIKQAHKEAESGDDVDLNKLLDDSTEKFCDSVHDGAKMIAENTVDWDGFVDQDGNKLEYSPEYLMRILTDPDNLSTYSAIIKAIEAKEGFFTA